MTGLKLPIIFSNFKCLEKEILSILLTLVFVFALAEYRYQFLKKSGVHSRHGLVGWLGTGSIGNTPSSFDYLIPNGGFGYRFEVAPRMNVRAEIGFGKDTRGFYFSFNEAFQQ